MSFLTGAFLAGLPLVTVPVIIHLLNRRRRNVIRWGAMRFLLEATTRRRRMWRVDDLLLMLLRALVVAAFIFALAQPIVTSRMFGTKGQREIILVLDTSMSTSRTDNEESPFERQQARARRTIEQLSDGDVVRILLASTAPRWLTPIGIPVNSESRRELVSRIDQVRPSLATADMLRCVQEAADAEPSSDNATRIITVLTDGQAYGWRPEAAEGWRGLKEKLEETSAVLNVVDVGETASATDNLSVESVAAARAIASAGETVTLTATVRNCGDVAAAASLISWSEADTPLGVSNLRALAPDESAIVTIEHALGGVGARQLTCRLDQADDLAMDNTGRLVVEVVDHVPILVVEAQRRAGAAPTDTGFLLTSLGYQVSGKPRLWHAVFSPKVIDVAELGEQKLSEFHCVVLANVPPLSDESVARLTRYVRKGGGVWIALGRRTDPEEFNRRVFAQGAGLSPLAVAEAVGDAKDRESGAVINPPAMSHPATKLLADTQRLDIDRVRVYRRFPFVKTAADKDVSILLTTGQGEPLVVEKRVGRGRVIVQGVPLGVEWSNLPACQVFVAMVHEWLWYLSEPAAPRRNVRPGEPLVVSLPAKEQDIKVTVTGPDGRTAVVKPELRDGRRVYSHGRTLIPGSYRMTVTPKGKPAWTVPFAVERDTDESDLAALDSKQSDTLALAAGLKFVDDPLAWQAVGDMAAASRPLWWYLLVALLAMMLIELALAWRTTRRRVVRTPGLTMNPR